MSVRRLTKGSEIHNNEFISYVADVSLYPEMMGYEYEQADMDCVNKLGKLEDLEDELGIDLPILFKAKKVYFKYNEEDINIKKSYKVCFDITNSCLIAYEGIFDDFGTWLELKDYKKTWWLKEDIKDE